MTSPGSRGKSAAEPESASVLTRSQGSGNKTTSVVARLSPARHHRCSPFLFCTSSLCFFPVSVPIPTPTRPFSLNNTHNFPELGNGASGQEVRTMPVGLPGGSEEKPTA